MLIFQNILYHSLIYVSMEKDKHFKCFWNTFLTVAARYLKLEIWRLSISAYWILASNGVFPTSICHKQVTCFSILSQSMIDSFPTWLIHSNPTLASLFIVTVSNKLMCQLDIPKNTNSLVNSNYPLMQRLFSMTSTSTMGYSHRAKSIKIQ